MQEIPVQNTMIKVYAVARQGPVGPRAHYVDLLCDLESGRAEAAVTKDTGLDRMLQTLNRQFSHQGVPHKMLHSRHAPYNTDAWAAFLRNWGIQAEPCPGPPIETSGLMQELVAVVRKAVGEKKDPRRKVADFLAGYNTNTVRSAEEKTIIKSKMECEGDVGIDADSQTESESRIKIGQGRDSLTISKYVGESHQKTFTTNGLRLFSEKYVVPGITVLFALIYWIVGLSYSVLN